MKPDTIISGGQTGADQGGLAGAKQIGIATGGWMPRGFLTEAGPRPDLRELYGMQEHPSPQYPPRTRHNVRMSDATLWTGYEMDSRGYACTFNAVCDLKKRLIVNPTPAVLRAWVQTWNIRTLNVAGPRASRDPGAYDRAVALIVVAFLEGDR